VVACSALRAQYRKRLLKNGLRVLFVHLALTLAEAEARMLGRVGTSGFVMPPELCASQFAALEPPEGHEGAGCLEVDATEPAVSLVAQIRVWLETTPRE